VETEDAEKIHSGEDGTVECSRLLADDAECASNSKPSRGVVVQRGERLRPKEILSERNTLGVHNEETGVTLRVKHQKS
jgi:hypothetical protein